MEKKPNVEAPLSEHRVRVCWNGMKGTSETAKKKKDFYILHTGKKSTSRYFSVARSIGKHNRKTR